MILLRCVPHLAGCTVIVAALSLLACATPQAVSKFSDGSRTALASGTTALADISLSCARRVAIEAPLAPDWELKPDAAQSASIPATCASLDTQTKALVSAAGVLKKYFDAIYGVAVFGTVKSTAGVKEKPSLPADQTFTRLGAADDLANLLGRGIIDRYQRKHLQNFLKEADPSVAALTQTLQDTISTQYRELLSTEGSALKNRYFTLGRTDARGNNAFLFLLDRTYRQDSDDVNRRRTAATAFAAALQQIREGHHNLATAHASLDASTMATSLSPYTEKIEDLVPKIRKAF